MSMFKCSAKYTLKILIYKVVYQSNMDFFSIFMYSAKYHIIHIIKNSCEKMWICFSMFIYEQIMTLSYNSKNNVDIPSMFL